MVYNSLTEAPRNLKEGIDWFMALRGTDAEKNYRAMGAALYDFFEDKPVGKMELPALEKIKSISKEFMEQPELKDRSYVKDLLGRYTKPMTRIWYPIVRSHVKTVKSNYRNFVKYKRLTPEDMAARVSRVGSSCEGFLKGIKAPDLYKSAYSSEASWEASCAKDPEACAIVLVGIAPMLHTGITSLWDASNPPLFGCGTHKVEEQLRKVLKALGYVESECCTSLSRFNVRQALLNMHHYVLDTIYDFAAYWAFY
ncbi:hypothetical protein, conserved [Babesia ovata]|uniref:Uncharacterized protein n=1 Tax=Babesia ovata TaxID=189622 RepID=A0A2H6KC44_9APIC|nr:uncharacterized protein BOVATA_020630 [Babesia ovata]GBE60570.1 hypothetical protein, conserved [Babesia ovata]